MTKRARYTLVLGLALTAAAFFALNCMTPFYADDYSYMFTYAADAPKARITNLYELWLSQLNHYKVMNGRAVVHTLVQLFLMGEGRMLFNICNTLVFLGLGFAAYGAAFGTLKNLRPLPLLAFYALLFLSLPGFGQSCLWLTGSVNYMWTSFAALAFLALYRADAPGNSRRLLRAAGMFCLGVLAGWSDENACLAAAVGLALLLARRAFIKKPFRLWHWTGAAGLLLGAAALFLAPAQRVRAEGMGGLGGLSTWIGRIPYVTFDAIEYLWLPLALGLVFLAASIAQSRGKGFMHWLRKYSAAICWLCSAVVSAYCMCAAPYFPLRAWCAAGVFGITAVLSAYAKIERPERLARRLAAAAACAALAACCAMYAMGYGDIAATAAAAEARDAAIRAQIEAGQTVVSAQNVRGSSRYNAFPPEGDLTDDPSNWQNQALAMYYGVESAALAE